MTVTRYSAIYSTATITEDGSVTTTTSRTSSPYDHETTNNVFPIQVRWRESDLASLETHPLSPGATQTSSSSGGGESDDGGDSDSGLSSGAIAGIVVGAVAVIAIIAAAVFFLCRRRNRRGQRAAAAPGPETAYQSGYSNGPASIAFPGARSSVAPASEKASLGPDFVATGNEAVDDELRRIAEKRNRLRELEMLDQQEAQLRHQAGLTSRCELPSEATHELAGAR